MKTTNYTAPAAAPAPTAPTAAPEENCKGRLNAARSKTVGNGRPPERVHHKENPPPVLFGWREAQETTPR